jgi:endonuclease YncB( thermonuclease family)
VPTPVRIDRTREERHRIADPDDGRPRIEGRGGVPSTDGSFTVGAIRGRFAALVLPDRQKLCTGASGARWACGLRAHAALSGLVTGRDLACRPMEDSAAGSVRDLADCRNRGRSLVETMVGEGWAEVDPRRAEPALVRLGTRAMEAGRGLWSAEPPP